MHLFRFTLVFIFTASFFNRFAPRRLQLHVIPHVYVLVSTSPPVNSFLITATYSVTSSLSSAACAHHALDLFFSTFLLLSGDIEVNPDPSSFTVCTLNTHSILHPLHSAASSDLVDLHKPDLVCLSETWIKPTTSTKLINCTPPGYTFVSTPRNFTKSSSSTGGGTGFLIREPFTQLTLPVPTFSSFESSFLTHKFPHSNLSVFNIYRPLLSSTFSKPNFGHFLPSQIL